MAYKVAKIPLKKVKNMGKNSKGIPDRWSDYLPIGLVIMGTRIVAFKVPLKRNICQQHLSEDEWFTPTILLERQPKLKTVIDLTNTFRYYNGPEEFGTKGIDHVKILVEGRGTIPTVLQLQKFFDAMDNHMEKYKDDVDALIGVHCTHGLNRTGYFVCRWMLERMGIGPNDAIERFNVARGHIIEREHLLNDLRRDNLPSIPNNIRPLPRPSDRNEYRSPLEDFSYDEPLRDSRYGRFRGRERQWRRPDSTGDKDRSRGGLHDSTPYLTQEGAIDGRRRELGDGREGYRNKSVSDRGNRRISGHNRSELNSSESRWRHSGGGGPSRADLDTNWRVRGPVGNGGKETNFRNIEGKGSCGRNIPKEDNGESLRRN